MLRNADSMMVVDKEMGMWQNQEELSLLSAIRLQQYCHHFRTTPRSETPRGLYDLGPGHALRYKNHLA